MRLLLDSALQTRLSFVRSRTLWSSRQRTPFKGQGRDSSRPAWRHRPPGAGRSGWAGFGHVIGFDMGGTSTDMALLRAVSPSVTLLETASGWRSSAGADAVDPDVAAVVGELILSLRWRAPLAWAPSLVVPIPSSGVQAWWPADHHRLQCGGGEEWQPQFFPGVLSP